MAEKSYKGSISVNEFHYGVLGAGDVVTGAPERVKFLQEISLEAEQEIVKAYGDGVIAEMAVSNGPVTVSSTFHSIPAEDKDVLFGFEKVNGLSAYGPNTTPPDVAVVFCKDFSDGSKEWFGLAKGKFKTPGVTGTTKAESLEFGADETEAEFMSKDIGGVEVTYLKGKDEKGETEQRDAIFESIFGQVYPGEETGGVEG